MLTYNNVSEDAWNCILNAVAQYGITIHDPSRTNGHIVVVVDGPLEHEAYPSAYWGRLGGVGERFKTTNWAWRRGDRDNVTYAEHDI